MKHMDGQIELRDGPRRSPIDLNSDGSTSTVHLVRHRLIEAPGSQSRANKPEITYPQMRRLEAHFTWRYKYWVPPHIAIPVGVQTRYTENRYTSYRVDHLRRYQRHGYHYEFEPPRIEMMSSVDERPRPRRTPPPRLPSPPPLTELQIGPISPGIGAAADNYTIEGDAPESNEHGAAGRIRPGTKAAEMALGPPLKPLAEVESAFQLQEHLKSIFQYHTHSSELEHTTTQLTHETALEIANPPNGTDRSLWLYELCRLLVIKVDQLVVHFFIDSPPCSAQTCPEMRASEWQYLCAVHEPPKPCCAIDYCCHTLDWAATTLASQKHFPSRLTLGNDATGGTQAGVRQLTNIMRRVYRIFAHAWFQHRAVFWQVESGEGLYMLFKTVCDVYALIPEENYTIPPEAEGLVAKEEDKREGKAVLKEQGDEDIPKSDDADATTTISTGATTRRHKSTHSFSSSVAAIAEGDEADTKAESPTKDKTNEPVDGMSISTEEAPLTQILKTAEKNEEEPSAVEDQLSGQPATAPPDPVVEKEGMGVDPAGETAEDKVAHEPPASEGDHTSAELLTGTGDAPKESEV